MIKTATTTSSKTLYLIIISCTAISISNYNDQNTDMQHYKHGKLHKGKIWNSKLNLCDFLKLNVTEQSIQYITWTLDGHEIVYICDVFLTLWVNCTVHIYVMIRFFPFDWLAVLWWWHTLNEMYLHFITRTEQWTVILIIVFTVRKMSRSGYARACVCVRTN